MKNLFLIIFVFVSIQLFAQTSTPDYKISTIKILPFDYKTGEFKPEIKTGNMDIFFNAFSTSLFVVVEVSGKPGSYEGNRKVEIKVLEGKKKKATKVEKNMLLGDQGKYFIPILLEPMMCADIKITARILGQKTNSTLIRTIPFNCGE